MVGVSILGKRFCKLHNCRQCRQKTSPVDHHCLQCIDRQCREWRTPSLLASDNWRGTSNTLITSIFIERTLLYPKIPVMNKTAVTTHILMLLAHDYGMLYIILLFQLSTPQTKFTKLLRQMFFDLSRHPTSEWKLNTKNIA